jgi:hypothetical protein
MFCWSTFVLQRRVNQPFGAVGRLVCDPWLLHAHAQLALGDDATLQLDAPFGVKFPVFGVEGASWTAPASLYARGHRRERVEIELSAWDERATELLLRPQAQSPHRWYARRVRRYFRVAHRAADALTSVLSTSTPRLDAADASPARVSVTRR